MDQTATIPNSHIQSNNKLLKATLSGTSSYRTTANSKSISSPIIKGLRAIAHFLQDCPYKFISILDPAGEYLTTTDSLLRKLSEGDVTAALSIYRKIRKDFVNADDFIDRYSRLLAASATGSLGKSLSIDRLTRLFTLSAQQKVDVLVSMLAKGETTNFKKIQNELGIPDNILSAAIPHASLKALGSLELNKMQNLQSGAILFEIKTRTTDIYEVIPALLEASLRSGEPISTYSLAAGVESKYLGDNKVISTLPNWQRKLFQNFDLNTYDQIDAFILKNKDYAEFVSTKRITPLLTKADLLVAEKLKIHSIEAEELLQNGFNLSDFKDNPDKLKDALAGFSDTWLDTEHVTRPFEFGASIFGLQRMFEYSYKPGVRRHDTVFAMSRIVELFRSSEMSPEKFFEQIMRQVHRDDGQYSSGTAFHHLNSLAEKLSGAIDKTLEDAQSADFIPEIKSLTEHFSDKASVFQSWRSLKKYSELVDLLKNRELLIEMESLRREGKHDLYNFLSALAFRPDSQIRVDELMSFWKEPGRFFANGQTSVSPIHYTQMPHLDLNPGQLRDALVTGSIDSVQALPTFKATYRIPKKYSGISVHRALQLALGSRAKGISGEAINVKKLFSEVQKILTSEGLTVNEYLQSGTATRTAETKINNELFNTSYGLRDEFIEVTVKLNAKSDPDGLIAGNDTASCMPFGSEKNNVYMCNPNCALLTVQLKTEQGSMRTIAQSVVTLDDEYSVEPAKAAQKLLSASSRDYHQIQNPEFRRRAKLKITCDNIETAPNYRTDQFAHIIGAAYQIFLRDYVDIVGDHGVEMDMAYVGLGYTATLKHLPRKNNHLLPLSPLSYSDNLHPQVTCIPLVNSRQVFNSSSEVYFKPNGFLESLYREDRIRPLSYLDTFAVSSIEHLRYQSAMGESFAEIANTITAMQISNSFHDRPNLSYIADDEHGQAQAYILAYEGRFEPELDGSSVRLPFKANDPIIYIADMASLEGRGQSAVELIARFMKDYKEIYLNNGKELPIVAEFRDSTSYRLLPQIIKRYQKTYGIEFEINELPTYKLGKSIMHPVVLIPREK